jgi:hypothetical protein
MCMGYLSLSSFNKLSKPVDKHVALLSAKLDLTPALHRFIFAPHRPFHEQHPLSILNLPSTNSQANTQSARSKWQPHTRTCGTKATTSLRRILEIRTTHMIWRPHHPSTRLMSPYWTHVPLHTLMCRPSAKLGTCIFSFDSIKNWSPKEWPRTTCV